MDIETLREYCLKKLGTTEELPFDEHNLVFKVMGKIFCILPLNSPESQCNLKCDPQRAIELRDEHHEIIPGFHMNKKHWNTIKLEGRLSNALITALVDHSYDLVVAKLPRKLKEELSNLD